jgi:hypothetical protein
MTVKGILGTHFSGVSERSDAIEGLIRWRRQFDIDQVTWADLTTGQDDTHNAGFANEPALIVAHDKSL